VTEIPRLARVLAKQILGDPAYVDRLSDYDLRFYAEGVRTILREIREPSEAMQRAGFLANVHRLPDGARVTMPADKAWQAIVDELLK
jgi:hypothetical protein